MLPSWLNTYGLLMCNWHSSGGDPIYAVGSFAISGKLHPQGASIYEQAITNLLAARADNRLHKGKGWTSRDRELGWLLVRTRRLAALCKANQVKHAFLAGSGTS